MKNNLKEVKNLDEDLNLETHEKENQTGTTKTTKAEEPQPIWPEDFETYLGDGEYKDDWPEC